METTQLADRLQKLRKDNGYSQEQLADVLNVSRQAVSKWECGDALPDTENLIALAKLYNCSIDEIVFEAAPAEVSASATPAAPAVQAEDETVASPDATSQAAQQEEEDNDIKLTPKQKAIMGAISATTVFASVIAYVLCGALLHKWHPAWIVFFAIPVIPSIADSIFKKDLHSFCYPVVVVAVYLLLGCQWGLWHPWWVLFLTVPVYYAIIDSVAKFKKSKEE